MDGETRTKLRNLARQARRATTARGFIMYAHAYLLQLYESPQIVEEVEKKISQTSSREDKFLNSAWSSLRHYHNLVEPGERNSLLRQLSDDDPPLEKCKVFASNFSINLVKDKQNLSYFHDWLIKRAGFRASVSHNVIASVGDFHVLEDEAIIYHQTAIELTPQQGRLLRELIKENGRPLRRSRIIDILWNEEENTAQYLSRPITDQQINRRISNVISGINSKLNQHDGNRWHIVPAGETSYKFVP